MQKLHAMLLMGLSACKQQITTTQYNLMLKPSQITGISRYRTGQITLSHHRSVFSV